MVRAKFKVRSNKPEEESGDGGNEAHTVIMDPVYSDDPASENHQYWQYTPAGYILLTTVNEAAWKQLEVGKEYYVDFTPVES